GSFSCRPRPRRCRSTSCPTRWPGWRCSPPRCVGTRWPREPLSRFSTPQPSSLKVVTDNDEPTTDRPCAPAGGGTADAPAGTAAAAAHTGALRAGHHQAVRGGRGAAGHLAAGARGGGRRARRGQRRRQVHAGGGEDRKSVAEGERGAAGGGGTRVGGA